MHYLYIIYSPTAGKYYIGETNNVPARVEQHNKHKNIKTFTGAAYDWEIKLIFQCRTREETVYLQKHLNKAKSRTFLEKVLERPQILQKLLSER